MLQSLLYAGGTILVLMTALYIISLIIKNASIVDIFWGLGFVIANWIYYFGTPGGLDERKWLVSILVTIWGLRLAGYILWRNWGTGEDYRYQQFREDAGDSWWWQSYFQVFLLQGVLMLIVSIPLLAAQQDHRQTTLNLVDYLGVVLWLIGFYFEVVGDWQLARFKRDPANKGKVMRSGLWRYTRHPNYFGEAVQWWGFFLIAAAAGGWWTIFSPIIMTLLLLRVSGVSLLEKNLRSTKEGYEDYVESTNAFLPWFPRTSK